MRKPPRSINVKNHISSDGQMSAELKDFLQDALAKMNESAIDPKQPPWAAFPEYERYSMGWRMGAGEDYWIAFHSWIRALSKCDAEAFVLAHPEPENWKGYYDGLKLGS